MDSLLKILLLAPTQPNPTHPIFYNSRAIAGRTARCRCKFRHAYVTAASRGFHCDSNAFELNNSTNHGKIGVTLLNYRPIYLLPLNSLVDSHCLR